MRSNAIEKSTLSVILRALMRANRLALEVSLYTGLRISDVLNIKTECLHKEKFIVYEKKTGKRQTVRLPKKLKDELIAISGNIYIFQGRLNSRKPRTRQAVWKDLNRVAKAFRLNGGVSPHSMRKTYAVTLKEMGLSASKIQKALNHSDPCVTALYMYADELALRD